MRHRPRFLGAFVVLCVGTATFFAGVVAASSAAATTSVLVAPTFVTGGTALHGLGLTASSVDGVAATSSGLDASLDWFQPAGVSTQFDADHVEQGRSVDPVDSYSRTQPGTMIANWTLHDLMVGWPSHGPFDIGTIGLSAVGTCNLEVGGSDYTCHLESDNSTILDSNPDPGPYVHAMLSADLTVTPAALATLRTASFGADPAGTASLSLGEAPITDAFSIPCTVDLDDHLGYVLGAVSTSPGITVQTNLHLEVGTSVANPAYPATDPFDPVIYQAPSASPTFPIQSATTSVAMTGTGATFDLGAVQENDVPPVADPGGPYAGTEGSPIAFDGSGSSSGCGSPTLDWAFSDGGVAAGASPQHTFTDDGTYSGQLTATDAAGRTSTTGFSVVVANVVPSVDAGTDTTGDWGRSVTFTGQASDPGTVDQATLQYTWDFGDGTPSASGAPNAVHAYATPGANGYYDATLTVCDKDSACSSDVRRVFVTKRDTTTAYTGDTTGTPGTPAMLRASLVDEYGQAVNGRSIAFSVGSDGPFNAVTNSNGIATKSYAPTLPAGSYSGSSIFAGDALYNPSSASSVFKVAKPTWLIYFGDFDGHPNKTIALRALLIDRTGRPLPGRTVTFALGNQSASATTDAHGIASTSLRLTQRSGLYLLTSTWTPDGGDATSYLGSSMTVPFWLQVR